MVEVGRIRVAAALGAVSAIVWDTEACRQNLAVQLPVSTQSGGLRLCGWRLRVSGVRVGGAARRSVNFLGFVVTVMFGHCICVMGRLLNVSSRC